MSEFALKTALPQYLVKEQERIEKIAAAEGLDFFPTGFEILTYDQMNEIAAYACPNLSDRGNQEVRSQGKLGRDP